MNMDSLTVIGLVVSSGFILGELASLIRFPKVIGYILAGLLLNPSITPLLPADFIKHTEVPNIALAFITFAVGGSLALDKVKQLGRTILLITVFEAQTALLFTVAGYAVFSWFMFPGESFLHISLPMALLFGALACPTDPSASLAVIHQFHAKGTVSSTILGVSGLDDIAGLINFTIVSGFAMVLTAHEPFIVSNLGVQLGTTIGGAVLVGTVFGFIITFGLHMLPRETDGAQIVIIFAALLLCFGVAKSAGFEELLATMTAGMIVANFSRYREKAFSLLERYTDEMIFIFFFTLSAMQLNFSLLSGSLLTVVVFIVFRFTGKVCGTVFGGTILSGERLRHTLLISLGLIPQGGIVVGLALTLSGKPEFKSIADHLLAIVIGTTIFHEVTGPLLASTALRLSGEIIDGGSKGHRTTK
jgi:NhaP-type Na+/H+ or K+/H+ antiporter